MIHHLPLPASLNSMMIGCHIQYAGQKYAPQWQKESPSPHAEMRLKGCRIS